MPRSSALTVLALAAVLAAPFAPPARATDAGAVSPPAWPAGVEATAELRDEYVAGEPVVVPVELHNGGAAPAEVPDLAARPWLVVFELRAEGGQRRRLRTTPPERDPGHRIRLPVGARRRVLLEVPSGAALRPGRYHLAVSIAAGGEPLRVAERDVRLVPARPAALDLGPWPPAELAQGLAVPWVQPAEHGFDLYLRASRPGDPARLVADWFLLRLPVAPRPLLSAGRGIDRHVAWMEGERTVRWLRVQGGRPRGTPGRTDVPWPRASLAGRPATDADGRLLAPLWVPAPRGAGGELRVLVAGGREAPGLPRVAPFPGGAPRAVRPLVDAAGGVDFLVVTEAVVEVYRARGASRRLPLPGRRVLSAAPGERILDVVAGTLPETEGRPGGRAFLVAVASEGQLRLRWLGLDGRPLLDLPPVPWPEDRELVQLVPAGEGAPGLLVREPAGTALLVGGARVPLRSASGVVVLRDEAGRWWTLERGAPVRVRRLEVPAAP